MVKQGCDVVSRYDGLSIYRIVTESLSLSLSLSTDFLLFVFAWTRKCAFLKTTDQTLSSHNKTRHHYNKL